MNWVLSHPLTFLIALPSVFALLIALIPGQKQALIHKLGFVFSLLVFVASIWVYGLFKTDLVFDLMESMPWIPAWNIQYLVGIDGVSLWLILLTTFLTPLVFLASPKTITENAKAFVISMLVLETGMIGVFCALDLVLFYVFWEVMLIPMYLIIGVWGGKRRIYAALKFFIYTMAGSLLMLLAILYMYFQAGQSFSLLDWYELQLPFSSQIWLFAAFGLAFAIKVPIFPLHTWLPDAHVEAPTPGSIILAGVLLKMGTYGFFRFAMPLFPEAFLFLQPYLIGLCVVGIIYGALVAMVQTDMKKLIAYSSVSHLGVVMLGLFSLNPTGMLGGLYQMLNHGISTGALFMLIGFMYERTHSREIAEHGGIAAIAPKLTTVFLIVGFSSIALPLTNGFVGEFLSFIGSYQTWPTATMISATAVFLSAFYLLWMAQRVFFGKPRLPASAHAFPDLGLREFIALLPLLVFIFWMGIYPKPFLAKMEKPIANLILQMGGTD